MVTRAAAATLVALLLAIPARAAETLWITCDRILTAAGEPIEDGRIVVRDGKVSKAGHGIERPPFSRHVDASDLTVTPGFIVPMTRIPLPPPPPPPPGEGFRIEMKPEIQAADEIRFRDDALRALLDQGVTLVGVPPLQREPGLPGLASVIATTGGRRQDALVAADAAVVVVAATPEPWRQAVSQAFEKADAVRRQRERAEARGDDVPGDPPPLARAVMRKLPVLLVAPAPALVSAAAASLPLQRMDVSLIDGTDLWWEADRVKALGCRVLTYPNLTRQRGTRFPINRAAEWAKAGVKIAFVLPEDSPAGAARLRDSACEMVRAGLSRELALKALTSEPAAALGIGGKAGSVQEGRRADLLFWSGDPFDPASRLVRIMSAGSFVERVPSAEPGAP